MFNNLENMIMRSWVLYSIIAASLLVQCGNPNDPQVIVDKSIQAHGGSLFQHASIEFDFRGRHYTSYRKGGEFTYTREFYADSIGHVKDILNNHGFERLINGEHADITEERAGAYTNSVNGVLYFALLPFRLNDPSVIKAFAGETELNGQAYYLIRVTFDTEEKTEDSDDIFLFWINKETFRLDFFAYSYTSEGGGVRFREAIKAQEVNGIVIQDYANYKAKDPGEPVEEIGALYKRGELEKLSEIHNENIMVEILDGDG
jgi:Family of unknown function (DUF6503)